MQRRKSLLGLFIVLATSVAFGGGKIAGTTGGNERGAAVFARDGRLVEWTVTGPSGLFEFKNLAPGQYMMLIHGKIAPYVEVVEGRTTRVDQSTQPKFDLEKELWGPSRISFAQSFVAEGTAVTGFSLWRASGRGKLTVSLYKDSPAGQRIAGPFTTENEIVWIGGSSLPADFVTIPGQVYALELTAANGQPWNHSMPRRANVYDGGMAFYDGVAHPESDLGITIDMARPGLTAICSAREDLHYIAEGPGSGACRVAGQTFIATTPNVIKAYANCGGWGGGVRDFIFSIHQQGPGGQQIGPACEVRMVCDWGVDVLWFPNAVQLTPRKQYYMQYRRADGGPFFSYLSRDVYRQGRAYRDGKMLPEQFDQLCSVIGEQEINSVIYPYNVKVDAVTETTARVRWDTGTAGDSMVHFGVIMPLEQQAGDETRRTKRHEVVLNGLKPGTVYLYRVSSDTHKKSSRRMFSRVSQFMTDPVGQDRPRFDKPTGIKAPMERPNSVQIINPGFEQGLTGWKRMTQTGRKKDGNLVARATPLGRSTMGMDGYRPHSGHRHYGWSYFGAEDVTWKEPREDWKREMITQRIKVQPLKKHVLKAFLLTGDLGSGWGRDSRARLAVDEDDAGLLGDFQSADQANVTQWFATQHQWMEVSLHFTPKTDHVTIAAEFLQWWALETSHLYVDEFSVQLVD